MTQLAPRCFLRCSSCLVGGALLALVAGADVGTNVGQQALEAGGGGPTLWAPEGPPLVDGPFAVQVKGGAAGAPGLLLYSAVEIDLFVPDLGATLFTGVPAQILGFVLDGDGESPLLFDMAAVDAVHCGGTVVMQAFTADPLHPIGVATSNGLRLTVGFPLEPLFAAPGVPVDSASFVRTTDLNGDGVLDLVAAGYSANLVTTHLGNGFGRFAPPVEKSVPGSPIWLEVADFDADGFLDVAAANRNTGGPSSVSILVGDGTGALASGGGYDVPDSPDALGRGDFDVDGDDDLLVGGSFEPVQLLLNQGDGTFVLTALANQAYESEWLAVDDFDGDGFPDFASTDSTFQDGVVVALGRGDGTFDDPVEYVDVNFLRGVASADLDEDGVPDLVTTARVDGGVCVWPGVGDGTFGAPLCHPAGEVVAAPNILDLDGNGDDDVVFLSYPESSLSPDELAVLFGNGDGTLSGLTTYELGKGPVALDLGDLDGDGHADAAIVENAAEAVSLRFGAGGGAFHEAVPTNDVIGAVGAADFFDVDHDGDEDGVVASSLARLTLLRGDGSGAFGNETIGTLTADADDLVSGDWDGDGEWDLAAAHGSVDVVSILVGDGSGDFSVPGGPDTGVTNPGADPVVADLDGDGRLDVAIASRSTTSVSVLLGEPGGFAAPAHYAVGTKPFDVVAADVDGDAVLDLVTANRPDGTLRVLLGHGDGTFASALTVAGLPDPVALVAADFDEDGLDDVAVANEDDGSVTVLLGVGDGTFAATPSLGLFDLPAALATGDLDGDGHVDLAVGMGNTVAFRLGQGDGTFVPVPFLDSGAQRVDAIAVLEHSGDGLDDLVVGTAIPSQLLVYENTGGAAFALVQQEAALPRQIVADDVDGDGEVDLLMPGFGFLVALLLGTPGDFESIVNVPTDLAPESLGRGDFDLDGHLDLFLLGADGAASVAYGNGAGGFQSGGLGHVDDEPMGLDSADFDGDGDPDLATANRGSGNLSVLLGAAGASFANAGATSVGPLVSDVVAGDVDGDGDADLVATRGELSGFLSTAVGAGDGSFALLASQAAGTAPISVVLADMDRDGELDAVVGKADADAAFLRGNGDGTFVGFTPIGGSGGGAAIVDDFDTDGALDVLLPTRHPNRAVLARGVGDGSFQPVEYFATSEGPTVVAAGDFDQDGRPDAIVLNDFGDPETVLLNQLGK